MSNKYNQALRGFTHILRFVIIKIRLVLLREASGNNNSLSNKYTWSRENGYRD